MIKYKFLALCMAVSSILVIHLVNDAQFLNATCVGGVAVTVISPFTSNFCIKTTLKLLRYR